MKHIACIAAIAFAPLLLFAAERNQVESSCPYGPGTDLRAPRDQQRATWHAVSTAAELLPPSATASSARGGRGANNPPANPSAPPTPQVNFIDTRLFAAMQAAGIAPTSLSS